LPWKTRKHSGSGYHGGRKGQKFLQRDYPRFEARRRAQFMSSKLKERLAKKLSHAPIGSVYYDGHKITLNFDGMVLSNKIVVLEHIKWVGSWSRSEPVVYIDDDVPTEYRKFVATHETCLTGNTEIKVRINGDVKSRRIKELPSHVILPTLDFNAQSLRFTVGSIMNSGIKKVYRIMLKSGRIIEATGDHKLFGENFEERTVETLTIGDKILCLKH